MYDQNRFFDSINNHLIAWTGTLSPRELEEYLHEPGGRGDNEPQSKFALDLGRAYDHDFIYAQASKAPTSIKDLAAMNYITDELLVNELSRQSTNELISCFIILWNAKRTDMSLREFAGGAMKCIGSWPHESPLSY